ncbi:kelch domain-containing protein 10-like [Dendronephthya gigantea]|uniref:kelch domain-containing protein 10-like n=1 Tax=Dendronephthya gigantea TaxID=151771 RepID=UPI00106A91F4|nr:kelch domain-containing protein 10-like [Dendronephthya gigantea]
MAKYQLVFEKVNSDLENLPMPRSGHRCSTDGVFLYCFGGFNPEKHNKLFYENIWCFHLSSKTWHKVITASCNSGQIPTCVASSVAFLHRGKLFVFGGSGYPFGMKNSNGMFYIDPKKQLWHYLTQTNDVVPSPGYGQGIAMDSDKRMYIFGGTKGLTYYNELHKFNFETCKWELIQATEPPSGRYRHEMVAIENGFAVIGGYGIHGACSLDKLPVYNYGTCLWDEVICQEDPVHGFPEPRRAHSCVQYEDNVYVCGGFKEERKDQIFDDIWKLNIKTFSWSKIPQVMPSPTYFHSAAVTKAGCMYIFGGIQQAREDSSAEWNQRTNNLLKMWLVIPPLERLCWEALCETIPQGQRFDTAKLGNLGLPRYLLTDYDAQFLVGLENDDIYESCYAFQV